MAATYGPEAEFDFPNTPTVADRFRDVAGDVIERYTYYDGPYTVTEVEFLPGAAWIIFARADDDRLAPKSEIEVQDDGHQMIEDLVREQIECVTDTAVDASDVMIDSAEWGNSARFTVSARFPNGGDA